MRGHFFPADLAHFEPRNRHTDAGLFGVKATIIYMVFTLASAVVMGLILDAAGFEKEIKMFPSDHQDGACWKNMQGGHSGR